MNDQLTRLLNVILGLTRTFKVAGHTGRRAQMPSAPEAEAILFIGEGGSAAMSDVAARLDVALTTAASMIARMADRGYIERNQDANDRRVTRVRLTAAGEAMRADILAMHFEECHRILAALTPEEGATLIELLEKVARAEMNTANLRP